MATKPASTQLFIPPQNNLSGGDSPDLETTDGGEVTEQDGKNADNETTEQAEKVTAKKEDKGESSSEGIKFSAFKDVLGKQGATIEDDDNEDELTQQELDKKKAEGLKAKKEDEKEEVNKVEKKSTTTEVDTKTSVTSGQRDFSGLPENVVPVFKKMSNESFNVLKPIFLEHEKQKEILKKKDTEIENLKQGKIVLPDSYYEHPQGYLLDPVFTQAEVNTQFSQQVLNHWNTQLAKIRKGEPWNDLIVDPKTGNASLSAAKEPTAEDEAAVIGYVQFAHQQFIENQAEMKAAAKQFKEKHTTDIKLIKEAEATYFPDFDKPEHPTASIQKKIIEALPPSMQKHPLASVLAKTAAANAMLRAEIFNLQKGGSAANGDSKINDNVTKNPKKGQMTGGGTKTERQPEVKFSDFKNLLNK